MRYIVSYDVSSDYDKYRKKIAQILIDYGLERIQYSVFLGNLTKTVAREIISKINGVIKEECPIDIRFFRYCASCVEDSFIITKDIKMPGFVLTKMEDALNVHVSYLTGKKFGIDIDQNGWLEVFPREPAECKVKKENKKRNQKKKRKDTKTNNEPNNEPIRETQKEYLNDQDLNDVNLDDNNMDDVNLDGNYLDYINPEKFDYSNEKSENLAKLEKETSEYLRSLSHEELDDFLGISNLEDLQEFTEYVLNDEKNGINEQPQEKDSESILKKKFDGIRKKYNSNNKFEYEKEDDVQKINYKHAYLEPNGNNNSENNDKNEPLYVMSKRVMFF